MRGRLFGNLFRLALLLATAALGAGLTLGFLGAWHPAFDSLSHFRAHFAVLLVVLAAILLGSGFRANGLIGIALGLGAFVTTLPPGSLTGWSSVHAAAPVETTRPTYKMLQLNLFHSNKTPEKVLSLIGRERPDVVTLNEVSEMWEPKLELLKAAYPYQIVCRVRFIGTAILSRRPFAPGSEPTCLDGGAMSLAKVDFGGTAVDVATLHLGWPWPFDQSAQLDQLGNALGSIKAPAILGGDLNATPWSFAVRRVAEMADMHVEIGLGATWLAFVLPRSLKFAGLGIDQIMYKGGVEIRSTRALEPVGSDHWPILVEFSLPAKPPVQVDAVVVWLADSQTPG